MEQLTARRRAAALAAALALAAGAALAQDDRILEAATAYHAVGRTDIVISLTGPYRYVSHALSDSGMVLQVRLAPQQAAEAPAPGHVALRWGAASAVPLDEITAQVAGTISALVLRFRVPVEVQAVRDDPDERTITVSIGNEIAATPPPTPLPPATSSAGVFVVNFGSSATPMTPDPALARAVGAPRRLYQTLSHPGDARRYQLQAGFFASEDDASAFLAKLGGRYPDAWVGEVTTLERDAAQAGAPVVDLATLTVAADGDRTLPPASVERLAGLMEEAGAAVAAGGYDRAATVYDRIAQYPLQPYRRHAQELLGVMRERNGQLAQARAAYEAYLKRYPEGADAERVRQRLQALLAVGMQPRQRVAASGGTAPSGFDLFGSFDQFYRQDRFKADPDPVETTNSLLDNDLDLNARRRTGATDWRLRLTGSYAYSFLDTVDSQARAMNAYLEFGTRDQQHSLRVGRQTRGSGGVLGRFDGLYYGYRLGSRVRANLVGGYPVDLSSRTLDTSRVFYGLGLDIGPFLGGWSLTPYAVNQQRDGLTDRQAVGAELRWLDGGSSLFALADYDVHFAEPNILNLIGSTTLLDATTLSLIADWRRSPFLSTGNALIGQTATTLTELKQTYSDAELMQLARDRTATSSAYTASVSQALGAGYRLSADATRSQVGALPASGGVPALEASGPDWYYGLQLLGADLLRDGDLAVVGLRWLDATTYQGLSAALDYRVRVFGNVKIDPRLRVDRRVTDAGETRWLYGPGLRLSYAKGPVTLELEAASDLTSQQFNSVTGTATTTQDTRTEFYFLGYRYAF